MGFSLFCKTDNNPAVRRGSGAQRIVPADALENRRYLVKKSLAAFELSTATSFRGARACIQRNYTLRSAAPPDGWIVTIINNREKAYGTGSRNKRDGKNFGGG